MELGIGTWWSYSGLSVQEHGGHIVGCLSRNMVVMVDLATRLDLQKICIMTKNSEYRPKNFSGLVMRLINPVCSALLFSSGKVIVSGCHSTWPPPLSPLTQHSCSPEDANFAARKVARVTQMLGFDCSVVYKYCGVQARFRNYTICNLVALVDLKFPINLDELNNNHSQFSRFEPEIFPGLFYQLLVPRVRLLIFVSGKFLVTGAKDTQQIESAIDTIYPVLYTFRKTKADWACPQVADKGMTFRYEGQLRNKQNKSDE
ncbi:hypothetical protein LAZ67_23001608 [Cordylochernes scorpioides]|uniref:TATA-box binding protein n=1 Tax=Cordylochernes scorpioides TaxID=51811 RepID=A0ABY6LR80_9ARAC|nr:hypothetical protein LAZ67_23001608 [Cordylochernes scorpioides]